VLPAALLTAVGLDRLLAWVEQPAARPADLRSGSGPGRGRTIVAALTLLAGAGLALAARTTIDRVVIVALAAALALQISGLASRFAGWLAARLKPAARRSPPANAVAWLTFGVLAAANFLMLGDALRNGPLWFRDYGLGGMQYGAFQIFAEMERYRAGHPETNFVFSPDWANGTDVVLHFFLEDGFPVRVGSIRGPLAGPYPFDENTVFVMIPEEYELVRTSDRVTDVRVEQIVPYPDGNPGFYFVRLRYVDNIDAIFAAERAARQALQESSAVVDGQLVQLRYSYLDSSTQAESIALVFDHDPYSLAKTYESNPFVLEMQFPEPRHIRGFSIVIGSAAAEISLTCLPAGGGEPVHYTFTGQGTLQQPELSFDLPEPVQVQALRVEMRDQVAAPSAQIHIWELSLR
jgi:hypothetical protein